jgi:hypothetical protein
MSKLFDAIEKMSKIVLGDHYSFPKPKHIETLEMPQAEIHKKHLPKTIETTPMRSRKELEELLEVEELLKQLEDEDNE